MTLYFEESVEVERKQIIELTETVKYARKYFDDFSRNIDEAGDSVNNFGVDCSNTSKCVKDSIEKIRNAYVSVKSALQPFAKVFQSISDLTLDFTQQGAQLADFVKKTNSASGAFQSLTNASKKYNGSAETTAKTLTELNKNLKDVSLGGNGNGLKDISLKYDLDLSTVKDADGLLELVAKKMGTLDSMSDKIDFGNALGIDESITNLMVDGLGKYKEHLSEAEKYNLFTPEDIERSKQFDDSLESLKLGFDSIAQNISKLLLPILVPLFSGIQKIVDYFVKNSDLVKAMFIELAAILIPILVALAIHSWATVAPILAIVAGIAAIIAIFVGLNVLVKEFLAWLNGEDSIFDKWLGDFESFRICIKAGFHKLGNDIVKTFKAICRGITSVFGQIVGFVKNIISQVIDLLPDWLKNFLVKGGSFVATVAKGVTKRHEALRDGSHAAGLGYVPFDGYLAELHQGESVLNKSQANIWRDLQAGKDAVAATANVPLASVPQGAISNAYQSSERSQTFNVGDITVHTAATDAEGIASDLVENIKMAFNGLDTGVLA